MEHREMITMIVPYYRQPAMLRKHLETWCSYSTVINNLMTLNVVDDCSPEPAFDVIDEFRRSVGCMWRPQLYRVLKDVPWNRSMARNLGSKVAETPWLLHVDTDHILPPKSALALVRGIDLYNRKHWYKFRRFRIGEADFTRNKDLIPRSAKFGEIKPHVDSFLCTKELYWKVGGYDPDYAGCLGGGGAFLRQLKVAGKECMAPDDVHLHVYCEGEIPDSSIKTLSRDTSEYGRRRRIKERAGNIKVTKPIRYPWERVL
jgi:hypothetical protein